MTEQREGYGENERQNPGSTETNPAGAASDLPAKRDRDASTAHPHAPSSEYEPNDSRNVTGAADTPDGRWSGDSEQGQASGEYEPRDSRNVTGTASTPDGRWTNDAKDLAPGDD